MSMACLNMFNNEHQSLCSSSLSPRISFSNDFANTQQTIKHESSYREAPVSSDFEFSVKNYTMIPADEVFLKGKLLPFKDNCTNQLHKMTLRDKLLVDDDFNDMLPRLPKGSGRWKERLGLKRVHIVSKKLADKSDEVLDRENEGKRPVLVHEEVKASKTIQELLIEGGSSCRDLENGT